MHVVSKLIKNLQDKEDSRPPDDEARMLFVIEEMAKIDKRFRINSIAVGGSHRLPVVNNSKRHGYRLWLSNISRDQFCMDFCISIFAILYSRDCSSILNRYCSSDELFDHQKEFGNVCTELYSIIFE